MYGGEDIPVVGCPMIATGAIPLDHCLASSGCVGKQTELKFVLLLIVRV